MMAAAASIDTVDISICPRPGIEISGHWQHWHTAHTQRPATADQHLINDGACARAVTAPHAAQPCIIC